MVYEAIAVWVLYSVLRTEYWLYSIAYWWMPQEKAWANYK